MYKYGDIIQFKPKTFYGKLIKLIDGSPYSHTAMFLKYEKGVPLFIESHERKDGVVISKLQEWGNYDVYRSTTLKPRPMKEVLEKLGTKYDGSMIVDIVKNKIIKKQPTNNDDTQFICSEFIDFAYRYKVGNGFVATPHTFYTSNQFRKTTDTL